MNARIILYISGLLIYGIFRSFHPTPVYDKIEIRSDESFILNGKSYAAKDIDEVIREFRKTIPPDQKYSKVIELSIDSDIKMGIYQDVKTALRKNGFRFLIFRDTRFWEFWK